MEEGFNVVNKGVFEVDSSRLELKADLKRKQREKVVVIIQKMDLDT